MKPGTRSSRLAAYHDFLMEAPGLKLTANLVSVEGFKLRQPQRSFADYLDRAMAHPNAPTNDPAAARDVVDMLSAYGFGRLGISELDIATTGVDAFHIGGFSSQGHVDRPAG